LLKSDPISYQLKLLNGFELCHEGAALEVPGQKSRALLCVLGLSSGKPLTRTYLSQMLWDGMDADQSATNLRQTLSVIKRSLGPHFPALLSITQQTLQFNADILSIDVQLPEIIDQITPKDMVILGGNGIKSRRFETWRDDKTREIVKAALTRTGRAFSHALQVGQNELALALAMRLIDFEPDNELYLSQAHRLLVALGRNHEADFFAHEHRDVLLTDDSEASQTPVTGNFAPIILIGRLNFRQEDKVASRIALALSEAVIGDLAESAWVRVIAPDLASLSAPMFGLVQNQPSNGRWNYRLDGTIQSNPLAASIWLTNSADQTVVWTQKFTSASVGTMADDIVSRVVASLESIVLDAEGKRATHSRSVAGYWEDLARARALFWRASQSANQEAEVLLDQMLEDAPHDVRVLTLAAYAKLMNAWSGWEGSVVSNLDQASRFSRRAIQAVPDDAWSLMTMATVLSARLDLEGARRKLEQALAIRPHLAAAKGELARVFVFRGNTKEAKLLAAQAHDASPRDPHASLWLRTQAIACWMDGHDDQAVEFAELAIEKRTNWYPNFLVSAAANIKVGNETAARQAIKSARALGISHLSAETMRCGHPFEDRLVFDRFMADLRAAGWDTR
jgi:tetratricopeptide (TPR) repeat protein